jgi:hypothetical protein
LGKSYSIFHTLYKVAKTLTSFRSREFAAPHQLQHLINRVIPYQPLLEQ